MPLAEMGLEGKDTARPVDGADRLNLRYATRLPKTASKIALGFLLIVAVTCFIVVYLTRLLGTYFPFAVLFAIVSIFDFASIDGKRFWWRTQDGGGAGFVFSLFASFVVGSIAITFFAPALNEVLLHKFPMILDFVIIILGLAIALMLYMRNANTLVVILIATSGLIWVSFVRLLSFAETPAFSFTGFAILGFALAYVVSNKIWNVYQEHSDASSTHLSTNSLFVRDNRSNQTANILVSIGLVVFGTGLFYFAAGNIERTVKAAVLFLLVCGTAFSICCFVAGLDNVVRIRKAASTICHAITVWLTYRPHNTAAGVYRPSEPWNRLWLRRFGVAAVILSFAAAVLPASFYFPLTIVRNQPWVDAGQGGFQKNIELFQVNGEPVESSILRTKDEVVSILNSSPEAWSLIALEGVASVDVFFVFTFFLAGVISVVVPLGFGLCTVSFFLLPSLILFLKEKEQNQNPETTESPTEDWGNIIEKIQSSNDSIERDSVLLGFHHKAGYPVLLPRDALKEHGHILGDTGSGKTAMGFAPILTQLIRMAGRDKREALRPRMDDQQPPLQSSIVIIDLKGDPALFHGTRHEAKQAGLSFRFFSNQQDHGSHLFNPFLQTHLPFVKSGGTKLSKSQWVEKVTECLDLYHGEGYGRGHFGELNKSIISGLLQAFPNICSFAGLAEYATEKNRPMLGKKLGISKTKLDQASSAFAAIERVAKILPLNAVPSDERIPREVFKRRINMPSVFEKPMVIYFYLRSALEPANASTIGKLAMHSLLTAAACRQPADIENKQVFLFVDEFQQVASSSLSIVLKQARSMNIATLLAHQTLSDLKLADVDLAPVVQANTRFKQFFAATDLKFQESIVRGSGKTIDFSLDFSQDNFFSMLDSSEEVKAKIPVEDRITQNDVIRMSDDPTQSIIQLPRGAGYARYGGFPFISRGIFHITKQEYDKRLATSWPSNVTGTFVTQDVETMEPKDSKSNTKESEQPEEKPKQPNDKGHGGSTKNDKTKKRRGKPEAKSKNRSTEDILDELDASAKQRRQNRKTN